MRRVSIRLNCLLSGALVLAAGMRAYGQDQQKGAAPAEQPPAEASPLAGAARSAKAQKMGRSKKVFTDDDMEATAGPLPRLKMDGAENADDVVAAIAAFKKTHTPEQTESAVQIWYDRYDEMLAAAIQENLDTKAIRDANYSNGYELCQQSQDYQQCNTRQMAELRGARNDQLKTNSNNELTVRVQHAFMKVRSGLLMSGLHYNWFKIRTTNNIDLY